jgi:hypothetical protein
MLQGHADRLPVSRKVAIDTTLEAGKNMHEVGIRPLSALISRNSPRNQLKVGQQISWPFAVLQRKASTSGPTLYRLSPFVLRRSSQLNLHQISVTANNGMQCPVARVLRTSDIVVDSDDIPIASNSLQDTSNLRRPAGKDRPASSYVLHLRQSHRAKAVELVENLWLALQTLSHGHLAGLPLDELTETDSYLLQWGLKAAAIVDNNGDRLAQLLSIETFRLLAAPRGSPPIAQQPASSINLAPRMGHQRRSPRPRAANKRLAARSLQSAMGTLDLKTSEEATTSLLRHLQIRRP